MSAGTSEPLAQAHLLLSKNDALIFDPAYSTTAGSDGHFVLKDIPQGRYRLQATMPGFMNQEYGQTQPNRAGAILDLTTPQTLRDVTIRMTAGGVISGRVYDQDGRAVEGVMIRALARRYQRDGKMWLTDQNTTITNDIGEYRLYWLPPGTYYVFATTLSKPEYRTPIQANIFDQSERATDTFRELFYPDGDDSSRATPLRVEPGSELRGIDFSLTRTGSVRIVGHARDASTRRPVVAADIGLRPKYANGPSFKTLGMNAKTDTDGKFEFRNIPPGNYLVSTLVSLASFSSIRDQQDVHTDNKDIFDLELNLRPQPVINGKMIAEDGEPLPKNRTVLVFTNFENGSDGTQLGTGLQDDGTFTVSSVLPGLLRVEISGFPDNFFIRSARLGNRDVLREGLDGNASAPDSLEVVVASKAGTVDGTAVDDRMEPAVGVRVVLMPNMERLERYDLYKTATSDQFGRFTMHGIVPGDYKMFAWTSLEPNIYFDPSFMEQYESQGKPVHLDESGHITVALRAITVH